MTRDLVARHAQPVPRYTSYPTANHFTPTVGRDAYAAWLAALPAGARLSLYAHIPFCREMCWYCACTTKGTQRYAPVARYLTALLAEIAHVGRRMPPGAVVHHMHWGGGSPSILAPDDIARLTQAMRAAFTVDPGAAFAVEIDPRHLDEAQVAAFASAGVNRVSLGVQDFDPAVQQAIGRLQGVAMTERAVSLFRDAGVASLNIDLVYGLPRQSEASLARTIAQVIALAPERIAAFGYAHLPARVAQQRLVDTTHMPDAHARLAQSQLIAALLTAAGYLQIGIDHFARATDTLATQALHRNFQGYTDERADALIGLGASAIGQLPAGYVQNAVATHDYERRVQAEGLATARGFALDDDDRLRAFVIERLMCDFAVAAADLAHRFGAAGRAILDEARVIAAEDAGHLLGVDAHGITVTAQGRPFVRSLCARFDRYFEAQAGRHAIAV